MMGIINFMRSKAKVWHQQHTHFLLSNLMPSYQTRQLCHWQVLARFSHLWGSFYRKISDLHLSNPRICLTFCQMLSYHVIYSLPWEYHSTIMVLSKALKILPGWHDILLICKTWKIKTNCKQPNQTSMKYAGGLWQRWE